MRTREHIAGLSQYVTVDDCDCITSALQYYADHCLDQFRWSMKHARTFWAKWGASGGWFEQTMSQALYEEARKWRGQWICATGSAQRLSALAPRGEVQHG